MIFALTVGTLSGLTVFAFLAQLSKLKEFPLTKGFPLILASFVLGTSSTLLVGAMFPISVQGVLIDKQSRSQLLKSQDVVLVMVDGEQKPREITLEGGKTLGIQPGDKVNLKGSQYFPGFEVFESIQKQ